MIKSIIKYDNIYILFYNNFICPKLMSIWGNHATSNTK